MQPFLVEIGTEELPPKSLRSFAENFAKLFDEELNKAELSHGKINWFATPRRLALFVENLSEKQNDKEIVKRGPAISAAFDKHGNPNPAAIGWAKSCGILIENAEIIKTDKGEWLSFTQKEKGKLTKSLLPNLVESALNKLPIPKPMRWGNHSISFIRPIHSVCLLFSNELIDGTVFNLPISRTICGHRFLGEKKFELDHADNYLSALENKGNVFADYQKRKNFIQLALENAAKNLNAIVDLDENLLEEVNSIVEFPVILQANFDEKFLQVPQEALVNTMKKDQKYFPLYDQNGNLKPTFLFVTNIKSNDPQKIIEGNERVIRPRLSDAEFFYKTDLKTPLDKNLEKLSSVIFQQKLGSLLDKTNRIEKLAEKIAHEISADPILAKRAAMLSKCDLMTNMVNEFPELQGIIGTYYAKAKGENSDVALAINEHYLPRFSGDKLPETQIGAIISIADKIDTLTGIFGINQLPKGDKDPFSLRRAALGTLRILVEKNLPLDLSELIDFSIKNLGEKIENPETKPQLLDFIFARFNAYYQDLGFENDIIQAVLARKPTKPLDFDARLRAVSHFKSLPESSSLAAANKRVANILSKTNELVDDNFDPNLLHEKEEITLANCISNVQKNLALDFEHGNYQPILVELAKLKDPIDAFFENVLVNNDDPKIRKNRLALLNQLRNLFLHVADISVLQ